MSRAPRSRFLLVVEPPVSPALTASGLSRVSADAYLEGNGETLEESWVVVNLCRSYQYLSKGYYVSLLAEARHQRVLPSLEKIEGAGTPFTYFRALQEGGVKTLDYHVVPGKRRVVPKVMVVPRESRPEASSAQRRSTLIKGAEGVRFAPVEGGFVEMVSALGKVGDRRFQRPASAIFRVFPFPLLRIRFYESEGGWRVGQIAPLSPAQASPEDLERLVERLHRGPAAVLGAPQPEGPKPHRIGCLWSETDELAPSDEAAIDKFARAAAKRGVVFEVLGPDDLARLPELDALLIRTVTGVNQPSFTFAQTAESYGIPVIDDPASILKCSNKIFLYELFKKHGLPTPATVVASKRSFREDVAPLGFPVILKIPDGTFSQAVKKASDPVELDALAQEMFEKTPLLLAQEFTPSAFDWRVGILRGEVLWVAKYHMAKDHWQIAQRTQGGTRYGRVEAVAEADAPPAVLELARAGAALLGDGLYGVDLKDTDRGPVLIEINDNPNLEAGYEDAMAKERPYEAILDALLARIEEEGRTGRVIS